jgi:hypothetical protein
LRFGIGGSTIGDVVISIIDDFADHPTADHPIADVVATSSRSTCA